MKSCLIESFLFVFCKFKLVEFSITHSTYLINNSRVELNRGQAVMV